MNEYNSIYKLKAVNKNCAGIDVHKEFVCVTTLCGSEDNILMDYHKFRTTKAELHKLKELLLNQNIKVVGIESTGKYWYPVYNALHEVINLNVYNARHIKNIPGKKTDKADSEWIARTTRFSELRPSFIPCERIRKTRSLSRIRKDFLQKRSGVRQLIHGYLEQSSIKIGSVLSDVFGVSGRNLLELLVRYKNIHPKAVAECLHGSLQNKLDEVLLAMDGYMDDDYRYAFKLLLGMEQRISEAIKDTEAKLKSMLITNESEQKTLARLTTIPGVSNLSAMLILAEVGFDLNSFPDEDHFSSWAGLAPGKHESAGKNKTGKIQVRKSHFRTLLVELALSASRTKGTYCSVKYRILRARSGPQKATISIAHHLAKAIYMIIKHSQEYKELGGDHFSKVNANSTKKRIEKMIDQVGVDVFKEYLTENHLI
jgi:transposase